MKKTAIGLLCTSAWIVGAQEHSMTHRHWQLTDNETLWVERYSNCQYGYYVLLPAGLIAHPEHPPSPHHGFLVSLPDVASKAEVSVDKSDRFLWVNAEYNATDESTLDGISDYEIDLTRRTKQNFKLIERHKAVLHSVPATRFKVEYDAPKGRIIEEEVVALRSGVRHELGLRTPAENYAADREKFEQTLRAFRFSRVPQGQCSND